MMKPEDTPVALLGESSRAFIRVPMVVFNDRSLGLVDLRVYLAIAIHARGGNIVSVGQRRLAEIAGVERRNLGRHLKKLAKQGHISTSFTALRMRSIFQLNSQVFGEN